MEYHSHDWHERQCHPVSEQVVLSFLCKHSPVKKKGQKTHHMCSRSYFLVVQDRSLDPCLAGFNPFALPVLCMLWFSHTTSVWLMSCQCTLFLQVSPPSHLPPGPITKEAVKHEPNQNTSRNIIGLFPSMNVCGLTPLMAVHTVDSFKNVS